MKKGTLKSSFAHAMEGIRDSLSGERNLRIHFVVMALVIIAGFAFRVSETEWLVCILWFAVVIAAELINTAVEAAVDLTTAEQRPLAKKAKDAAAGGVLAAAAGAAVSGIVIFLPKVIGLLKELF